MSIKQRPLPLPPQITPEGTRDRVEREEAVAEESVVRRPIITPSDGPSILLSPGPWSSQERRTPVGNDFRAPKGRLRSVLLASVALAMLSLIGAVALLVRMKPVAQRCTTPGCNYYATLLRESLNESVPPCQDLYQHVCSRWDAQHSYSVRTFVYNEYMATLASNMETMVVPQESRTAIQEAAVLFRSCTDVYNGTRDNTAEAKALLQKFGISWPVVSKASNVLRILSTVSATWYWGSVLRFEVSALNKRLIITPSPFFQFLIERRTQLLQKGWDRERYKGLFEALVEAFALPEAGRPLSFKKHLVIEGTVLLPLRNAFTTHPWRRIQNVTLDEVVDITQKAKPRKAWEEELTTAFNGVVDVSYVVAVENVGFFLAFFELLRHQGEHVVAYYVGWGVVQLLALVSSGELIHHYFVADKEAKEDHSLFCVKLTHLYMGPVLYASYVRDDISIDALRDGREIGRSIEKASWDSVTATTWWQKASIAANLLTATKIVGYLKVTRNSDAPIIDQFTHIPEMSDNILTNMRVATRSRVVGSVRPSVSIMIEDGRVRFYHFSNDTLQLHPIAFQKPFYSSEALPAIKYGTMGAEVAYALASRLFSVALSNVEFGEALRPTLACIFDHELSTTELRVDQIELLQRLASIRIAQQAYLDKWQEGGDRLRNYEHLSGAQLFFLIWCFIQCGLEGGNSVCNEPVRLIAGFADAFRCAKNKSVTTGKDCRIF